MPVGKYFYFDRQIVIFDLDCWSEVSMHIFAR